MATFLDIDSLLNYIQTGGGLASTQGRKYFATLDITKRKSDFAKKHQEKYSKMNI